MNYTVLCLVLISATPLFAADPAAGLGLGGSPSGTPTRATIKRLSPSSESSHLRVETAVGYASLSGDSPTSSPENSPESSPETSPVEKRRTVALFDKRKKAAAATPKKPAKKSLSARIADWFNTPVSDQPTSAADPVGFSSETRGY